MNLRWDRTNYPPPNFNGCDGELRRDLNEKRKQMRTQTGHRWDKSNLSGEKQAAFNKMKTRQRRKKRLTPSNKTRNTTEPFRNNGPAFSTDHNSHQDLYDGSFYVMEDNTVCFSTDARFKDIHSVLYKFDYCESHYGIITQLASLVSHLKYSWNCKHKHQTISTVPAVWKKSITKRFREAEWNEAQSFAYLHA